MFDFGQCSQQKFSLMERQINSAFRKVQKLDSELSQTKNKLTVTETLLAKSENFLEKALPDLERNKMNLADYEVKLAVLENKHREISQEYDVVVENLTETQNNYQNTKLKLMETESVLKEAIQELNTKTEDFTTERIKLSTELLDEKNRNTDLAKVLADSEKYRERLRKLQSLLIGKFKEQEVELADVINLKNFLQEKLGKSEAECKRLSTLTSVFSQKLHDCDECRFKLEESQSLLLKSFKDTEDLNKKERKQLIEVDNEGNTLLHYSIDKGDLLLVQHFLKCNLVEINHTNTLGETPLHTAAKKGDRVFFKKTLIW